MDGQYYIYIMTNKYNNVLYTGVTNDLKRRAYEHKIKAVKGFTEKYNCNKLVWYEVSGNIESAIIREKQIKKWKKEFKHNLINEFNPEWKDLFELIV